MFCIAWKPDLKTSDLGDEVKKQQQLIKGICGTEHNLVKNQNANLIRTEHFFECFS